ncbi:MAG TPA: aldo/keto reductase [Sedimentisphaerales bacterium]|nr:aldo/keto reductase [Sedimentisphaerales bacterium]
MQNHPISRRQFIERTAALAGGVVLAPLAARAAGKKTAVDLVPLGKTGLKTSRLGIGIGSNSGNVQAQLGQDGLNRLVRYAYDQGIQYIDVARSYRTHTMVREAIKDLPREKIFILTKMGGSPENPLAEIDNYRKTYGVDYIDCLLVHCTITPNWEEERKRAMDAMAEAKDKKMILSHGVSCHSLPALKRSVELNWVDVHLVRVNPQGAHMDTPRTDTWNAESNATHVPAVMEQIKLMKQKGRGIIGMKLIGNGDFTRPEDREKSIRFAMQCGLLDCVTIGLKSPAEIDEAIQRMNAALADVA